MGSKGLNNRLGDGSLGFNVCLHTDSLCSMGQVTESQIVVAHLGVGGEGTSKDHLTPIVPWSNASRVAEE